MSYADLLFKTRQLFQNHKIVILNTNENTGNYLPVLHNNTSTELMNFFLKFKLEYWGWTYYYYHRKVLKKAFKIKALLYLSTIFWSWIQHVTKLNINVTCYPLNNNRTSKLFYDRLWLSWNKNMAKQYSTINRRKRCLLPGQFVWLVSNKMSFLFDTSTKYLNLWVDFLENL